VVKGVIENGVKVVKIASVNPIEINKDCFRQSDKRLMRFSVLWVFAVIGLFSFHQRVSADDVVRSICQITPSEADAFRQADPLLRRFYDSICGTYGPEAPEVSIKPVYETRPSRVKEDPQEQREITLPAIERTTINSPTDIEADDATTKRFIASQGGLTRSFFGIGYGRSDHSRLTISDREWNSVTVTDKEDKPPAFALFFGGRISNNLSYELNYLNFGSNELSGYVERAGNAAYAETEIRIEGLGLSILTDYQVGKFTPYLRLGLMYGHSQITSRINDPSRIFQNPNSSLTTKDVVKPIYGFGLSYRINPHLSIRADHTVVKGVYADYINNINNGYFERDVSLTTLGLLYNLGDRREFYYGRGNRLSFGLSGGGSRTSAKLSGGAYSGNIWDLRTNTLINTPVSGAMSDDRTDSSLRYSLFWDSGDYEYEIYIATLGEFNSRSGVNQITGGGNALTGSANRTLNAYGFGVGRRLDLWDLIVATPRIGFAMANSRDEIYNNLDFSGLQGTDRGPIVKKSLLTPTVGLTVSYRLNYVLEVRGGVDYFYRTGNDRTLGEGSVTTLTVGVKVRM